MFFGDGAGLCQVRLEVFIGISYVHCRPTEHVRWTNKTWIANLITELLRCLLTKHNLQYSWHHITSHKSPFIYLFITKTVQVHVKSKAEQARLITDDRNVCFCNYSIHTWPLTTRPWKTFQHCTLTWWIFVPSFIEIPPLSTEILHHGKYMLTDGQRIWKHLASATDSSVAEAKKSIWCMEHDIFWFNYRTDLYPTTRS